jgi:hypothetical protein
MALITCDTCKGAGKIKDPNKAPKPTTKPDNSKYESSSNARRSQTMTTTTKEVGKKKGKK